MESIVRIVLPKSYTKAYEDMIRKTATPYAPWYVIPADNKWFTRLAVAAATALTLEGLNLSAPKVNAEKHKELEAVRTMLEGKHGTSEQAS